ncbi:MAG: DinB family protein [Dehalococcoidia bacterium]|nr:DinB family protein [Dehalococcoidia bacterium]
MTPEGASYYLYLQLARDGLFKEMEALPEGALNAPLGVPETNTIYASAFHAASATEYWLGVYVAGGAIDRDRSAEFRSSGDVASLRARWDRCLQTCRKTIEGLAATEYDTIRSVNLTSGADRYSVRDCLLHVVEHVNLHLGHIQIARQIWEHRPTVTSAV